ncbi:Cytochrome P450 734A1 [Platanthera guangdongensis]|uniref:Cytochrome P450 734A1 n=1 Tax=Platanthera guangdongensis TaxID=2320717 RepID=A0ABR2LKU8_9ASPA
MVKEVLLSTSSGGGGGGAFERIEETPLVKCLLGDGLFRLRGVKWARHRRIISPAFNMERVKEWVPVMAGSAQRMLDQWEEENEGRRIFEIDVHKQLHNFTADIISRVAFGSSYDECKRIFQLQEEQMHHVSRAIRQIYIHGFRFLPTESNKRMWRIEKEIHDLIQKLVQSNQDTDKNSRDMLNLMTCAKKHQKHEERIETREIVEECKAFYFAGKETGANFLTWVLILLASRADWQEKAREEVIRICGQQHVPDAEDLGKLNLVNMILYETLRLYPPVVSLTRQTCKNIKLGSISIPAGTQLYIPILAIHHDVKIWGEDANEFNPLRFSDAKKHMASFVPFGLGARICIGRNLIMMEAKLALTCILRRYVFVTPSSYVHAPMQLLTLQPQYGANIQFQRIYSEDKVS